MATSFKGIQERPPIKRTMMQINITSIRINLEYTGNILHTQLSKGAFCNSGNGPSGSRTPHKITRSLGAVRSCSMVPLVASLILCISPICCNYLIDVSKSKQNSSELMVLDALPLFPVYFDSDVKAGAVSFNLFNPVDWCLQSG